jgi:hypothetical protein
VNQYANANALHIEFTFPTWNSDSESWDDYLDAVEAAYGQFRQRSWQCAVLRQTAPPPSPDKQAD